jgi:hypothetical protein
MEGPDAIGSSRRVNLSQWFEVTLVEDASARLPAFTP